MEDYIGTKLLFETSKGIVSGTLRKVEEDAGRLVVESEDGVRSVSVKDIQKLEIVEENMGNCSKRTLCLSSMSSVDERTGKGEIAQSTGCKNKSNNKDWPKENTSASNRTGRDGRVSPETSKENYYGMMRRAFAYFGPLEEEFSSVGARQTHRILSTYFDVTRVHVEVFVRGDDVLSRMGFILGRLLLQSGNTSSVVCSENFAGNARYKQAYLNSGGIVTDGPSGSAAICIYACNGGLIPGRSSSETKGVVYLDIPESKVEEGDTRIGLCFGSAPSYFRHFNGTVYFVDVEYPAVLYTEFGLVRPTKSKIYKIK